MAETALQFKLCHSCLARQGKGRSGLALVSDEKDCFICRGMSENLEKVIEKTVLNLGRFEFRTFSVGVVLPPGVQEREDTLRSELKIRGAETVKSELAGRLAKAVVSKMRGKKVDRFHPDATVLVDIGEGGVAVTSKSLFFYGRYTKPRGVSQRRLFCEECNGKGCETCEGTGYSVSPSVEGSFSKKLERLLGSKKFKFTWFGSEDADSIVYPPGRPVVIEAKNPRSRHLPRTLKLRTGEGGLTLCGVRIVSKRFEHPGFTFMTRAVIRADRKVSADELKLLQRQMKNSFVQYRNNKGRMVDKRIYFVRASARGKTITAEIKLDGGLPVKRLVSGEAVSPSFSETIQVPLRCDRFDILRVWAKS
jgi:tRNA pseudouridine synthase 10